MKRLREFLRRGSCIVTTGLLAACAMAQVLAQQVQNTNRGVVDDWTHHHVLFSNPGTRQDAITNGRREEWQRIVTDSRYGMQWIRRYGALNGQTTETVGIPERPLGEPSFPIFGGGNGENKKEPLQGDWAVTLGASNASVAIGMYTAKFSFSTTSTPSCTNDFVVFQ